MSKYVCIRKEQLISFLNNCTLIQQDDREKIQTYYYKFNSDRFIVEKYKNGLILLEAPDKYFKGLVDVTDNSLFSSSKILYNISNKKIIFSNAIIEGTDGVGKTSTITALIQDGIICSDRSSIISKYMLFDIPMETRCSAYVGYLNSIYPGFVIFMINNSRKSIEERINNRKKISKFDKMAYEYNVLYHKTYIEMTNYSCNPIGLVDCTGLSLDEQINTVKNYILRRISL